MVIFLCFLAGLFFIFLLLQKKVTLGFTFKFEDMVTTVFVTVYIFGDKVLKNIMIYPANNKKRKPKRKKIRRERDLRELRSSYAVFVRLFRHSFLIREFRLYIKEGTGDACYTALLYGLLWNVAAQLSNLICREQKVKKNEIKIEPDYNRKIFNINFNCIFSLKIVNIIVISKELYKLYLKNRKGGDAGVRSSNRRFNDYSHAEH